ncbi:MAG TPA: helix-turn-helix transcriptional regulator [Massilibacterium sp.]|nr:helix-turn-helix transcriptional regulator [Massilibacterium sp.]
MKILFGSILRGMRKSAGMSQEDIALDLHMSISNVSRLETDKYELKAADLIRWANATQSQEVIAAMILGIDVGLLQQALEFISSATTMVGMIFLGGI